MFCIGAASTRNALQRQAMEDTYVIKRDLRRKGDGLFALFDGHGGDKCSKWCAENIHRLLIEMISQYEELLDVDEILSMLLSDIDKLLAQEFASQINRIGCTATVLYLDTDTSTIYSANVGDSKMLLHTAGNTDQLTMCHNTHDESECRRVRENGGRILFGRVDGSLAVTRALGDLAMKPYISPLPYTTKMTIKQSEDDFVIAASDGLWDVVSEAEAVSIAKDERDCDTAAQLLMKQALKQGSQDNITCIVVRFFPGPTAYTNDEPVTSAQTSIRVDRENVFLSKRGHRVSHGF